ncbi:MAG: hypothetical protein Q7W16_06495 [Coriobacteriia bacterium]|nr:hypothetical protein [Coriobacteriia bacterium]
MASVKTTTPAGHGEVLTSPDYEQWAGLARANAVAVRGWDFDVCGLPAAALRDSARREALARAGEFSARLGVPVRDTPHEPGMIVMTGHQPELYHPGVWVKDFLLQRLADEIGAAAIDLVVDSDGFDAVEIHSPCFKPEVRVCRAYLAVGTTDGCFACAPVPSVPDLERFCEAGAEQISSLPAPALGHHFALFCEKLMAAAGDAANLAELVTFARRRYEASASTDYLELPVTSMARSRAFATLLAHIARDAVGFAAAYNDALADFRDRTGTRNPAQPFPDLRIEGDLIELPVWHLAGARRTVWARTGDVPALVVDGEMLCELADCASAPDTVFVSSLVPAPKALMLTLFARLFVADFFIHGVGGGRYDSVTDDVIRRYFGVEPPTFAVASMTMYLPLGARVVTDTDIEAASMALNRMRHNPDQAIDQVEFDSSDERGRAQGVADEKARLIAAIASPGADKKALGRRIREVNQELGDLMAPYRLVLQEELDELLRMREASEILTDRTYPFCYWSPSEVADKAR